MNLYVRQNLYRNKLNLTALQTKIFSIYIYLIFIVFETSADSTKLNAKIHEGGCRRL